MDITEEEWAKFLLEEHTFQDLLLKGTDLELLAACGTAVGWHTIPAKTQSAIGVLTTARDQQALKLRLRASMLDQATFGVLLDASRIVAATTKVSSMALTSLGLRAIWAGLVELNTSSCGRGGDKMPHLDLPAHLTRLPIRCGVSIRNLLEGGTRPSLQASLYDLAAGDKEPSATYRYLATLLATTDVGLAALWANVDSMRTLWRVVATVAPSKPDEWLMVAATVLVAVAGGGPPVGRLLQTEYPELVAAALAHVATLAPGEVSPTWGATLRALQQCVAPGALAFPPELQDKLHDGFLAAPSSAQVASVLVQDIAPADATWPTAFMNAVMGHRGFLPASIRFQLMCTVAGSTMAPEWNAFWQDDAIQECVEALTDALRRDAGGDLSIVALVTGHFPQLMYRARGGAAAGLVRTGLSIAGRYGPPHPPLFQTCAVLALVVAAARNPRMTMINMVAAQMNQDVGDVVACGDVMTRAKMMCVSHLDAALEAAASSTQRCKVAVAWTALTAAAVALEREDALEPRPSLDVPVPLATLRQLVTLCRRTLPPTDDHLCRCCTTDLLRACNMAELAAEVQGDAAPSESSGSQAILEVIKRGGWR